MIVNNEREITGEVALALRLASKLPQWKFWTAVGSNQTSGCRYERNKLERIPRPVRILLFAIYVVGLDIDADTEDGVACLLKVAQLAKMANTGQNSEIAHHPV